MNVKRTNAKSGFTLIEVLLVVVIIGILAAVAIPRLGGRVQQAEIARARSDIAAIGMALRMYELDMGQYPQSLSALVNNPGGTRWQGPYLESGDVPSDPWGREYIYTRTDNHYRLRSLGPDGTEGSGEITN